MEKQSQKKLQGEFILEPQPEKKPPPQETPSSSSPSIPPSLKHEPKQKPHPFSSFCRNPDGIEYQNPEPGENLLLIIRRAFITNFPWITTAIFLSILPLFIGPLLLIVFPFIQISPLGQLLISIFYYTVIFGYAFVSFVIWHFHSAIITNKRIIDVDIPNILHRDIAITRVESIVDVKYEQGGIFKSLFRYGDILVQTEAIEANFEFDKAPNPAAITEIIGNLIVKKGQQA